MRYLLLFINLISINYILKAQNSETIITELKTINKGITQKDCNINAAAISNRGMNVFMADKTSYLSESIDLSYYTNYVTFNSSEGKITVTHNLQSPKGIDEPIKGLFSFGASATIPHQFASTFLDKSFEQEFGMSLNYKWLGKVKSHFSDCSLKQNKPNQKQQMDALRAGILHLLEMEINKKDAEFKASLNAIDSNDILDENIDTAKAIISRIFYTNLQAEYEEKFAKLQAETLTNTYNFKYITTGWTTINAYLPIVTPNYFIASTFTTAFQNKHSYPLNISISHTRLWETAKAGRFFLTLGGRMLLNNSKLSYGLNRINYSDYKNQGGTDTSHLNEFNNNNAYIGNYSTFITPSINAHFVYFPPDYHLGLSFSLEKNFGDYNPLNAKLSVPIILINSKRVPAINVNFDILFLDITNNFTPYKKLSGKTIIGLEIGIPFSRLMF